MASRMQALRVTPCCRASRSSYRSCSNSSRTPITIETDVKRLVQQPSAADWSKQGVRGPAPGPLEARHISTACCSGIRAGHVQAAIVRATCCWAFSNGLLRTLDRHRAGWPKSAGRWQCAPERRRDWDCKGERITPDCHPLPHATAAECTQERGGQEPEA